MSAQPLSPEAPRTRPSVDTSIQATSPLSPLARSSSSTSPAPTHRKRGSIASPIQPILSSTTHRRLLSQSTPQHTPLAPHTPAHLTPRHIRNQSTVSADPTNYPQLFIGGILASIVLSGITLSLWFNSSLDTSVASLLPARSAYLARKENILNQLFVKKSWGWTSLAFALHWSSSFFLPQTSSTQRSNNATTRWSRRLYAFALATLAWILFSLWAFGPSLNHRLISLTGGTCAVALPQSHIRLGQVMHLAMPGAKPQRWGEWVMVPVPHQFCYDNSRISARNHPALFSTLRDIVTGQGVVRGLEVGTGSEKANRDGGEGDALEGMVGRPRFHAGFDISGHMFLLTLASLMLAKELAPGWRRWFGAGAANAISGSKASGGGANGDQRERRRSSTHRRKTSRGSESIKDMTPLPPTTLIEKVNYASTLFGTALIALWGFMLGVTAIYFHNPPEKLAGLGDVRMDKERIGLTIALGLSTSALISFLVPSDSDTNPNDSPGRGQASAMDMLEDVFVGEDENTARREAAAAAAAAVLEQEQERDQGTEGVSIDAVAGGESGEGSGVRSRFEGSGRSGGGIKMGREGVAGEQSESRVGHDKAE